MFRIFLFDDNDDDDYYMRSNIESISDAVAGRPADPGLHTTDPDPKLKKYNWWSSRNTGFWSDPQENRIRYYPITILNFNVE